MVLSPAPIIITFPQASLRSRTVGFPESGSDLGLSFVSLPRSPRSWSAGAPTPRGRWFAHNLVPASRVGYSRHSVRDPPWDRQVPRVPLPPAGVTDPEGDLTRLLEGRYPFFIAPTDSCADPKPSRRLRSKPWSAGLCRLPPAPAGPSTFPALPPRIFPQMPGPLPRRSPWCTYSFLPTGHRPSPFPNWVGTPQNPGQRLQSGDWISRLQPFTHVQASGFARHPDRSHHSVAYRSDIVSPL